MVRGQSLYDLCKENGEYGQQLLFEFGDGNNSQKFIYQRGNPMRKIDPRKVAYKQWDDPLEIEYLNSSLRRYFFVDYYDSTKSNDTSSGELDDTVFKKISSQYISLDDYTKEKLLVNQMISGGVAIPEDMDRRLTITKHELESVNLFSTFGRV